MQDNHSLVSQAMMVHNVSENIPHTTPLSSLSDQPAHGSLGVVQSASDCSLSPTAGVPLSNKPAFLSSMYPTQNTSQEPLFSGTSQCEGSSSRTPEEVSSLGLSQPISQSSFNSVPLSSLSQAVGPQGTSPPFGPSQTASEHPLLSVPLSSLSQFGDLASGQQGISVPSPLLYSSEHAPLSGSALGQPGTSFMLGPSCASSSGPLLSAPLSSLSQSGGLSSHVTSQNPLLSVPLSSLSQQCGQSGTATPSGPSQMASQSPLLSVPLSSLSQSGSLQCGQLGRIPSLPGSSQTISQSHLSLVPLSSLTHSGSVPSHQMATAASLGPSQNPLLSLPLSSLSKSGSSQTGHLGTLSSLIPPQATSQSPLLSVSLSSLSQSESIQTGQLGTLPSLGSSQTSSQSPLLSIPLSSLSQSGSVQSGQLGAVSSLNPSQGTSSSLSGSLLTGQLGRLSSSGSSMVHDSRASDPSCLKKNLEGLKIVGDDARGVPVEKDFNHNQKRKQKQKPATLAVTSPTLGSISGQMEIKEKKQFSTDVLTYQGIGMGSYGHRQPKIMATGDKHRPQLTSSPSMFALTLSCAVCAKQSFTSKSDGKSGLEGFCEQSHTASDIIPFDFSSPSPDDAVRKRQKGAFARKK